MPDERLRLIFTCCHPALAREAQVALTLRLLGGLTTAEVARAFLVAEPTMAQRLTPREGEDPRRRRSRSASRPTTPLPARLEAVLDVIYLVFNEGYAASAGDAHMRRSLCAEALRLAAIVAELMPDEPEALGLQALLLAHEARRDARVDADGELVLLEDQDRARWDARRDRARHPPRRARAAARPAGPLRPAGRDRASSTPTLRRGDTRWDRIAAYYATSPRSRPTRSWSSTARWRSPWPATWTAAWRASTRSRRARPLPLLPRRPRRPAAPARRRDAAAAAYAQALERAPATTPSAASSSAASPSWARAIDRAGR